MREFDVQLALGDTLDVFFRHLPRIMLIGALPAVLALSVTSFAPVLGIGSAGFPSPHLSSMLRLAVDLLAPVLYLVGFAVLMVAALRSLATGSFDLRPAIRLAFARALPFLAVCLLAFTAVLSGVLLMIGLERVGVFSLLPAPFGFAMLILPVAMLAPRLWMAAPASVFERRGPLDSMRRSLELTRGRHGRLLLLALVAAIGHGLASAGLVFVVMSLNQAIGPGAGFLFGILAFAALGGIWPVLSAVAYCRLRGEKEGAGIEELAATSA